MTALRRAAGLAALALVPASPAAAQEFELSVPSIMRGEELVGSPPSRIEWTDDGRWVYFYWKPGGQAWHEESSLWRVAAAGGEPERLGEEAADSLGPLLASGDLSPDGRREVVAHRGDLYLVDRRTLDVRQLTDTRADERSPVFGRAGRTVYFVRDDNVFALDLTDASVRQLTDIRRGPQPPEEKEAEGHRRFLEEQQEELFEHIRREAERRERQEARREAREAREPATVWLARGERVMGVAVEPGGRWAVLEVGKEADAKGTMVPDWITRSGYTEPLEVRSKVGDEQEEGRMALVSLETGEASWLDLNPKAEEEKAAEGEADATPALTGARFLGWNEQGTAGLIGAVAYDFKDQWLYRLDAATGELALLAHDRDDAWIGGPCAWWLDDECAGWMPSGDAAWFLSERDGWMHLYRVAATGGEPRRLTDGEWEVVAARISPTEDRFLLHTTEGSPFERHVWHMPLSGGRRTRITTGEGHFEATPSPDASRLAVVHSQANRPPELYLMRSEPGAAMRRVTTSPTAEWLSYDWTRPEIVRFPAQDGTQVPARIYRPRDVGATPNGAGVIFVHGAGYLHNVHRGWSSYYREYMFHHLLAERGYTVIDVDYRGSAGYGRDWRTAIYRHMGGKDLSDQVDAARYLAASEGVDPARIGIYGGSYGGFITLMALFTEPEHFAAGAALRSVTDWAHYNHWYTARILNQPQGDTLAYRRSSPIYFAEGLEDPLLIAHGMVDTNVHFQDVVRLAQRLIELGKKDWEMAVYPVESHGFVEPSSWTDEYRRILELFELNLRGAAATTEGP